MDAEVSADNMSVIIDSATPLVAPIAHLFDDTGQAQVNGRLDPGDLCGVCMKECLGDGDCFEDYDCAAEPAPTPDLPDFNAVLVRAGAGVDDRHL